jgi:hypothetical protein
VAKHIADRGHVTPGDKRTVAFDLIWYVAGGLGDDLDTALHRSLRFAIGRVLLEGHAGDILLACSI